MAPKRLRTKTRIARSRRQPQQPPTQIIGLLPFFGAVPAALAGPALAPGLAGETGRATGAGALGGGGGGGDFGIGGRPTPRRVAARSSSLPSTSTLYDTSPKRRVWPWRRPASVTRWPSRNVPLALA